MTPLDSRLINHFSLIAKNINLPVKQLNFFTTFSGLNKNRPALTLQLQLYESFEVLLFLIVEKRLVESHLFKQGKSNNATLISQSCLVTFYPEISCRRTSIEKVIALLNSSDAVAYFFLLASLFQVLSTSSFLRTHLPSADLESFRMIKQ